MRVLIHNDSYRLDDKGSIAATETAARRVQGLWPDAEVGVLTDAPSRVTAFMPRVTPIPYDGHLGWPRHRPLASGKPGMPGVPSRAVLYELSPPEEPPLGLALRTTADPLRAASAQAEGREHRPPPALMRAADLVLCAGGRHLSDLHPVETSRTLAILESAIGFGIPTAMMSQGIGPLDQADLVELARRILPRVGLLGLREGRFGPAVLERVGVPRGGAVVTGDDVLEAVAEVRTPAGGRDIGVCIRIVGGTGIMPDQVQRIRAALHAVADSRRAYLSPIVVSERHSEDRVGTREVTDGYPGTRPSPSRLTTPAELMARVGRCRVVVTATYEAAVMALGQGVPVVAVARSRSHCEAFDGLAAEFPSGCRVLSLDTEGLEEALIAAITSAWQQAVSLRGEIRAEADRQIVAAQALYQRLPELVAESPAVPRVVAGPAG
jgi:hypothetical protein